MFGRATVRLGIGPHSSVVFFSTKPREIGWEERLQNDRLCVEWDIKPYQDAGASALKHATGVSRHIQLSKFSDTELLYMLVKFPSTGVKHGETGGANPLEFEVGDANAIFLNFVMVMQIFKKYLP